MKRKLSIKLNLDNPCSENWELMTASKEGKYCEKCKKDVVDMTSWNDDDFIDYFNNKTERICGRLYESQVNKLFVESTILQQRKFNYEKAFALIMSFFAFNSISAQSQPNKKIETEITSSSKADTIKISGIITGENSTPLNNVSIQFDNKQYYTDSKGYFEIVLNSQNAKNGLLVFNYEGLNQEARNYNVAMQSTTYNIQMHKPVSGQRIIAGGIRPNFYLPGNNNENFVSVSTKFLDAKTKKTLDEFAMVLRSNPNFRIALQTYSNNNKNQSIQKAWLVKKYLVDKNGIDEERLLVVEPKIIKESKEKNKIYFEPAE